MKFIHTADWHLGNTFHGHSRTEEHRHFLNRLLDIIRERQPDALLITGDVFDSANPSAQAEELLYDFLLNATTALPGLQVVLTAGNHDSAGRIEAPAALLKTHNVYVRGTIHYNDDDEPDFEHYILPLAERGDSEAKCVCFALPFLRCGDYPSGLSAEEGLQYYLEKMHKLMRKSDFKKLPIVVAAHFYATRAEICNDEHSERLVVGGQDCVNADIVTKGISYTALGHIHKGQLVPGTTAVYYAGSPLPMSFSEIAYRQGVNEVEITSQGDCRVERLEYKPLRKLIAIPANGKAATAETVFDAIAQLPNRGKNDDGMEWPYLEIRIEEHQPEPTLMHDVMEALSDKAVHFCRMIRVNPEVSKQDSELADEKLTAETLSTISPLQMARKYFTARYNNDMPQELIDRFKQAEKAAEQAKQDLTD